MVRTERYPRLAPGQRTIAALAVVGAVLTAWAALGAGDLGARGGKLPSELTIGATLPLSGPLGPYGPFMQQGLELGLADAERALGGTKLKLKTLDSQALASLAVTQARSLVTRDKVVAIVTAAGAPPVAQLKIAQQYKVPLLNGAGNTPDLVGHEWLFNDAFMVEQGGFAAMKYANDKLAAKTTSILIDTNYPPSTAEAYKKIWSKLTGTTPRTQFVPYDASDAGPYIDKMLSDKPDVIFLSVGGSTLSLVLKQLVQRGVTIPVASNDGAVLAVPEGKDLPFKVYYANPATVASKALTTRYKAKYKADANFLVVQNYNLGRAIGTAISMVAKKGQTVNGENIQRILDNPAVKFPADQGTISFTSRHIVAQNATIIEVDHGTSKQVGVVKTS